MSVTAVPLPPVKKSALWTLWIGLALLVGIAIGFALASTDYTWPWEPTVKVETLTAGKGGHPTADDFVLINYIGKLADGTKFDAAQQVPMELKSVVPGFADGIVQMQAGGKYRLTIPSKLGYGAEEKKDPQTGKVVIPANSDLVFDIDLLEFKTRAEVEAIQQQMQMMQQQMMQQGAAPGGAGGAGEAAPGAAPSPSGN